jgi:hypothetical protein
MYRLIIIIFFISKTFGQTLKLNDLGNIYDNKPNCEHKYLLKKGFRQDRDTSILGLNYFYLSQSKTNERVGVVYYEGNEGDYKFTVYYYLSSKIAYANFLASVKKSKLKYSKRNQRFQLASSSYSGEWLTAKGLIDYEGKKYYAIEYIDYAGKEIIVPIIPYDKPNKDTLGK